MNATDKGESKINTLQDLVCLFIQLNGHNPAIEIFEENHLRTISYGELYACAESTAEKLSERGVNKGDYVVLYSSNCAEWIIACCAVIMLGAVVVPIDSQCDDEALNYILHSINPAFIFTTKSGKIRLENTIHYSREKICLLDDDNDRDNILASKSGNKSVITCADAGPCDMAVLFFTSGTTGVPKGVPLTHSNLVYQISSLVKAGLSKRGDGFLMPLPMHHVYPFVVGILTPLALGARIVLPHSLTGPRLLQSIKEGQVNVMIGVPRLYEAFYKTINDRVQSLTGFSSLLKPLFSLSQGIFNLTNIRLGKYILYRLHQEIGKDLRLLTCGGASIEGKLVQKLGGLGYQMAVGYGLTETSPLLSVLMPDKAHFASVGQALEGTELRINSNGEIFAKGPGVFSGYLNSPQKKDCFDSEGWLKTGDCGNLKDGYLSIEGRQSSLIVSETGKKIDPEWLEEHYQKDSLIKEVGVLQRDGKLVCVIVPDMAKIQTADLKSVDAAIHDAIDRGSLTLPSYKRLSGYEITSESLPRTAMGKIKRHKLSTLYDQLTKIERLEISPEQWWESLSKEDKELMSHSSAKIVMAYLNNRLKVKQLSLDTNVQLDLGIDSLEWLEISLDIRDQSGVELKEGAIAQIITLRDLLQAVVKNGGNNSFSIDPFLHWQKCLSKDQKKWLTPLNPFMSILQRFLFELNRLFFRLYFRIKVEGLENIQKNEQYMFVPNHASYLDPFTLAAALPMSQLLKSQWAGWVGIAFANPLARFGSRLARAIPIDAENAISSSLAFGAGVLDSKHNLIWFPEGRRTLSGELQEFKPGIGLLLSHKPVLVIPVYMKDTDRALPPGKWLLRPVQIVVRFGKAQTVAQLDKNGSGESPEKRIVDSLFREVSGLGGKSMPAREKVSRTL